MIATSVDLKNYHTVVIALEVIITPRLRLGARVEVLTKNNVRLAVNSGEKKKFFHRKVPASFSVECAESGEFL